MPTKKKTVKKKAAKKVKKRAAKRVIPRPIEEMSQAEKAGLVNEEYIAAKLVDVAEGIGVWEAAKPMQRIQAIKMLGEWKQMFIQRKEVHIDVQGMLRALPTEHIERIIEGEVIDERQLLESSRGDSSSANYSG